MASPLRACEEMRGLREDQGMALYRPMWPGPYLDSWAHNRKGC